jgi:subtilisin family serine protease
VCPSLKAVIPALNGGTPAAYPAAYVFPVAEKATPSETWPVHEQHVFPRFAVEIMVKQAAQAASGGPAQDALEDVRDAVKAALCGFQPTSDATPVNFASGRLIDFSAGMATWRDEFTTEFYERTT